MVRYADVPGQIPHPARWHFQVWSHRKPQTYDTIPQQLLRNTILDFEVLHHTVSAMAKKEKCEQTIVEEGLPKDGDVEHLIHLISFKWAMNCCPAIYLNNMMNNYVPDVICMNAIMHSCLPVLSLYCGEHIANFKISSLERLMIIQKQIQIPKPSLPP